MGTGKARVAFTRRRFAEPEPSDSMCQWNCFCRFFAAILFCAPFLVCGQDESTFSTDVKVVNLFTTVLGKKGEIIRDLAKEDFLLSENGRPQSIRYFSRESDLPLTLGLMVDTSMSQRRVLD